MRGHGRCPRRFVWHDAGAVSGSNIAADDIVILRVLGTIRVADQPSNTLVPNQAPEPGSFTVDESLDKWTAPPS
ncbi:hypothetical protein [Bradyrhizobium sp. NAS96.2]|uniref:hypothetical protein n=1 Tax=Bradyrhizobium sp. NAS96.2 TaxID=1680160 RepID=UPI00093E005A|nr:hypothetical protein [Bradyrhizobium sp. NAS96.2]OKO71201.1 hypothetical protein AC628_28990 [Bradyrhizobium sp. NAS96.2]